FSGEGSSMASVNKVIIVGNLGRDPETRSFPSGGMGGNATIATTDRWKDKQSGEMKEHTEWHRGALHDRLAEIAGQQPRKGSQVYIEGSIRTRKYTDKDGVEKFATEIRADSLQMLGKREAGGAAGGDGEGAGAPPAKASAPAGNRGAGKAPPAGDDMDDD